MYGIPNMKLEKTVVQRRVDMMQEEGVEFRTSVDVGKDISAEQLLKEHDAVILACGSSNPRNIKRRRSGRRRSFTMRWTYLKVHHKET